MKAAVLALAFCALANAAVIDVPHHVVLDTAAVVHPPAARAVLARYGLEKPAFDNEFIAFAHAVGAPDTPAVAALRDLYEEPVLLFFQDPLGEVISYYAQSGIQNIVPEVRSSIGQLIGSADSYTIAYKPDRILGDYKSILPNYFFQPTKDVALIKFLNDPIPTPEDPTFSFNKQELAGMFPHLRAAIPAPYEMDELPLAYRLPVPLNVAPFAKSYFSVPTEDYYKDYSPVLYKDYSPAFYKDYYPTFYKDYTTDNYRDYSPVFYPYPKEYYPREYPITKTIFPFDAYYPRAYPESTFFPKNYPEFGIYPKSYPEYPFYAKSYPIDYYRTPFYPLRKTPFYPKTIIHPQVENALYPKTIVSPQLKNALYPQTIINPQLKNAFYPQTIVNPQLKNAIYPQTIVNPQYDNALYLKSINDPFYGNALFAKTIVHPQVENAHYPKTIVDAEVPLKDSFKPQLAVVPPAYRFIKADYPYFTATPAVDIAQQYKVLP